MPSRLDNCLAVDPDQSGQRGMQAGMDVDPSEMYSVRYTVTEPTLSTAKLMALALDHRIQAEKATCLEKQRELHRVADIYMVLATIDAPIGRLELLVSQRR